MKRETQSTRKAIRMPRSRLNLTARIYFAISLGFLPATVPILANASIPEPTSLEVTSTLDDGSVGTLRWAILEANGLSGGINDSIVFATSGVIELTSNLPPISQDLTIEGNNSIEISGVDQFQIFAINQNITLNASDMTLSNGRIANGGMVFLNRALAFNSTNMTFTGQNSGSAVFINNSGVATYNNAYFYNNSVGIASDHGSTPQLPVGATTWAGVPDSVFQNRTYINNSTFVGNSQAVMTFRFTHINGSTFLNNNFATSITGLNRTQIYNSTFIGNTVGYYNAVWMPTHFNMGTDNRLLQNNTFIGNLTAIINNDSYNNGQRFAGWSTFDSNTFEGNTTVVEYFQWDGSINQYYTLSDNDLTTPHFVFTNSVVVLPPPPSPEPTAEPTMQPSPEPEPTPSEPTTPDPQPEPTPQTPEPTPTQQPEPQPTFAPEPVPTFTPQPEPVPEPTFEPTPLPTTPVEPTPEPTLEPKPEELPKPVPELTPTPTETTSPNPLLPRPTPSPSNPVSLLPTLPTNTIPTPQPTPAQPAQPEPTTTPTPLPPTVAPPTPEPITSAEALPEAITTERLMQVDLTQIVATNLTESQADALIQVALETFLTAEAGSPEYEQALDALYLASQQDDIVVEEALASVPVIGQAAVAIANVLNVLSNVGSDLAPEVRETAQEVTVLAVIVTQIAGAVTVASSSTTRKSK